MNALEVALSVQEQRIRAMLCLSPRKPFVPRPITNQPVDDWPDWTHEGDHAGNKYRCPCNRCRETRTVKRREQRRRQLARQVNSLDLDMALRRGAYQRKQKFGTSRQEDTK